MTLDEASQRLQAAVERALGEPLNELSILQRCDSTNQLCLQAGQHKSVIVAREQSAGRGRRGNRWHSPQGENIYCSIGLKKTLPAQYLGLAPLCVGVSIASALHCLGFEQVSLKWPNDIVVDARKLGGILIESRPLANDEFFLVIGFGLNVALQPDELAAIGQPAISLRQLSQDVPERDEILSALISAIVRDVLAFSAQQVEPMLQQFARFDCFRKREVEAKTRSGSVFGRYVGVHPSGQLQLETAQGIQLFSAAEISLRAAVEDGHAAD